MVPMLVCLAVGKMRLCSDGSSFLERNTAPSEMEPIGMIWGITHDLSPNAGFVKIEEEIDPRRVNWAVREISRAPGYRGALIGAAIVVGSYEEAKKLHGFVPFYDYSGEFYDLAEFTIPEDIDGHLCHRLSMPDGIAHPRYDQAGAAVVSLIPLGQLGNLIFLQEDDGHFFYSRMPRYEAGDDAIIDAARQCLKSMRVEVV
jgi:hypothetical protein